MHTLPNQAKAQPKLVALFASDIHLTPSLPATTDAFFAFLQQARQAEQLYLLGDLFEYWAGDDDISTPYNQQVVDAIRAVSDAGTEVFWIAGNRDFLIGKDFAAATGAHLLEDPSVIGIAGQQIVITHGDAQCTDDAAYMAFRAQVRQAKWQSDFLSMPLAQRKAIIEGLRKDSKTEQKEKTVAIMDVNQAAIAKLFADSKVQIMIHGHTHRPALHQYPDGLQRYVLPDWECDSESQRGGWLAIYDNGDIVRHALDGKAVTAQN
ncbi:UDP-2,3-diacylglucosamine diphosphatase [Undibacterium terreum]|uniref:UDP-2,3-diacylglucosamine hydrolase n=1 Tax=Undibacterium terreum TaxID=1224302 RepID=A0A916XQD0_9BURK|nr:UDP-2,3-diacylglucosamine hydrolase [Undibacterium terreum]